MTRHVPPPPDERDIVSAEEIGEPVLLDDGRWEVAYRGAVTATGQRLVRGWSYHDSRESAESWRRRIALARRKAAATMPGGGE